MSSPRFRKIGLSALSPRHLLILTAAVAAGCAGGNVGQSNHNGGSTGGPGTGGSTGNPGTGGSVGNGGFSGTPNGGDTGSGNGGGTGNPTGGTIGTGGDGSLGGSLGSGGMISDNRMCKPTTTTAQLPANFNQQCGICHSAFGAAANPLVPNLFTFTAQADTTQASFTALVRSGKPGTIMPAFATTAISDADIAQIYGYFKAGQSSGAVACPGADGTLTANLGACSGQTMTYSPLFTSNSTTAQPVSYVDPTTKHIIFRGAGRVRFRHEMEETFEIYHDHYFEDRTFSYTLDDSTPAGGSTIAVTFTPVANQYYSKQSLAGQQQGGADLNIRYWKVYGGTDGNRFYGNAGGASNDVLPTGCAGDPNSMNCDTRKYTYVINRNIRANRAPMVGDQLQIEFGMFLARYPGPDGKHVRNTTPLPNGCTMGGPPYDNNCYTQANYYSDSFRYAVGKGVITPSNEDCSMDVPPELDGMFPAPQDCSPGGKIAQAVASGVLSDRLGPAEAGWSGGTMTQPYIRQRHDLYYSQMSPAILGENAANFVTGRRLFHTNFTTGAHIEANNGMTPAETAIHANLAGPLLNQLDCEGCHSHNNRGFPPAAGMPFDSVVVKLQGTGTDAHGAPNPDPNYGRQLQNVAISGSAEGSASFSYTQVTGKFDDGTAYTLTKPTTTFSGLANGMPVGYSTRLARPLIGMGLLEAIPEADILAHADPTDCDGNGIKGVPNLVFDPEDGTMKVGRFGWKASKASVKMQVAEALNLDIGVTTSVFPKHDCGPSQAGCTSADKATPELSDADLEIMATYMRTLGVPARRDLAHPDVMRGESIFAQVGCVNCHQPNQHTGTTHPFVELQNQVIHPYSDLLLHDMGPDLADNSSGEYKATSTMWRTPPLWTIGLCDEVAVGFQKDQTLNPAPNLGPCHYLHDGRAASLIEAVLWHGGEAAGVKAKVLALSATDRAALLAFLKSL
ncbi:MAG TPA: di-heme oxidoredictase family protein [Polyangia bacterium]|nr:di-heme oxidoredictase family protein [Polyangia bacterium]